MLEGGHVHYTPTANRNFFKSTTIIFLDMKNIGDAQAS